MHGKIGIKLKVKESLNKGVKETKQEGYKTAKIRKENNRRNLQQSPVRVGEK